MKAPANPSPREQVYSRPAVGLSSLFRKFEPHAVYYSTKDNMCVTWHRMYLWYFERVLQEAAGDLSLRLPYWDYETNAGLPAAYRDATYVTPRGSVFGPVSKAFIVISDSQHRVFGFGIIHLIREIKRFFCACAPVVGLINEVANHSPASVCCNSVTAEQENRSAM
jgi:Common central domain of tyrosinase